MAAGTAIAVLLPGCTPAAAPQAPEPLPQGWIDAGRFAKNPPWKLGRSSRGDISAWMVMFSAHVEYGVQEKYRSFFRDVVSSAANWDPNKQIEDIGMLLKQEIDLLLIDPLDTTVVAKGVSEAMQAGIPVILASTRLSNAPYVSWVATNAEERGSTCAAWLVRNIGRGQVAVLVSHLAADDTELWLQGVRRQLQLEPDIGAVFARCAWDDQSARQAMAEILRDYASIDGVLVHSGILGRGAVRAFSDAGRAIPPISGADDWNGWLRTAKEYGVPFLALSGGANLGLRCVQLATQVLSGQTVPRYLEFPYQTFDQSMLLRYYRPDLSDHYWAVHDLPEAWIERMFRPGC
jgi:ribose transport system substrate-binding protein